MKHLMNTLAIASLMLATAGAANAQGDGAELAASGLFLTRYVASVAPVSADTTLVEEVRVVAPRVKPAEELLQEISSDLDGVLDDELQQGLAEVSLR